MMTTINSKWAYSMAGGASVAVLALMIVGPNVTDLVGTNDFRADKENRSPVTNQGRSNDNVALEDTLEEKDAVAELAAEPSSEAIASKPRAVQLPAKSDQVSGKTRERCSNHLTGRGNSRAWIVLPVPLPSPRAFQLSSLNRFREMFPSSNIRIRAATSLRKSRPIRSRLLLKTRFQRSQLTWTRPPMRLSAHP